MQRSKYVAILVLGVVVIGLLAAQFSLNNPTETTEALPSAAKDNSGTSADGEPLAPSDTDSSDSQSNDSQLKDSQSNETGSSDTQSSGIEGAKASSEVASIPTPAKLGAAPSLEGLDGWLQTDATGFDSFAGQVRIVQFWTYSCHNCTATIPHLREIYADHQSQGLEIIGVHSPEFDYERDPDGVAAAAIDLGVTWPIALDSDKINFRSWQKDRRFWPRTYVLDQTGEIRYDHIGEGNYEELAATVDYLIENGP